MTLMNKVQIELQEKVWKHKFLILNQKSDPTIKFTYPHERDIRDTGTSNNSSGCSSGQAQQLTHLEQVLQ